VPFARKVGPAGQGLALDPPFYVGHAHNLLLVPDRVISRVAEEMPVPPRGRGPLRH